MPNMWERRIRIEIGKPLLLPSPRTTDVPDDLSSQFPRDVEQIKRKVRKRMEDAGRQFVPGVGHTLDFKPFYAFEHYSPSDSPEHNWAIEFEVQASGQSESTGGQNPAMVSIYNIDIDTMLAIQDLFERDTVLDQAAIHPQLGPMAGSGVSSEQIMNQMPSGLQMKVYAGWQDWTPLIFWGDVMKIWPEHEDRDTVWHFTANTMAFRGYTAQGVSTGAGPKIGVLRKLLDLQPLPWRIRSIPALEEPNYEKSKAFDSQTISAAIRDVANDMNLDANVTNNEVLLIPKEGGIEDRLFDSGVLLEPGAEGGLVGNPTPNLESQMNDDVTNPNNEPAEDEGSGGGQAGLLERATRPAPPLAEQLVNRGAGGLAEDVVTGENGPFPEGRVQSQGGQGVKTPSRSYKSITEWDIKAMLRPGLLPMHWCRVRSEAFNGNTVQFQVQSVEHVGSSFGDEYYSKLKAKPLQAALPP